MLHKIRRLAYLPAILAAGLSLPGCEYKAAAFFAPELEEALQTATISGSVTSDDETALAGVSVSLSGPETASAMTDANGMFSFEDLLAGDYMVSITEPAAHDCAQTSQEVSVSAGGSGTADFTCDRIVPTLAEITGSWLISYAVTAEDCGVNIPPFEVPATMSADGNELTVEFPDAPAGITGPYDELTGEFDGTTPEVDLGDLFSIEMWQSTFWRQVNGQTEITMDGESDTSFRFPDNSSCLIEYAITGMRTGD